MNYYQDPTNIVAHGGSGSERSRWFDSGLDASDLETPAQYTLRVTTERESAIERSQRPVGGLVARRAAELATNRTVLLRTGE